MMIKRLLMLMILVVATANANASAGEVQVLSWHLTAALSDDSGNLPVIDGVDISDLSNPLDSSSVARIGDNIASAAYDHSWIVALAFGDFNTSFTHNIRSPKVRTVTTSAIFITATEPVRVMIDGRLDYSHTPGDLDSLNFFASVRDESTSTNLFSDQTMTGALFFDPSNGTVLIHGEVILEPGTTYRLRYGLDSSNTADHLPTGTLNATGFVNFSIRPVPEPASALLLCVVSVMLQSIRRDRRRS